MGVYIRNIEMPKSCWDCFACHDGWCIINQKIEGHRTVTHSCPLIEIQPHGRLIDADAAYNQFLNLMDIQGTINPCQLGTILNDASTIIESEE